MRLSLAALACPLAFSVGCLPGAFPRTGDVVDPGVVGLAFRVHGGTLAQGKVTVDKVPKTSVTSLPFGFEPNMALGGYVGLVELSARYGLFHGCEGSANLSILRPGLELRCALTDERRGSTFSIASSVNGAYSTQGRGMWTRVGFDVSKRFGKLAPLLDVYVSTGPERTGFKVDVPAADTTNEYEEFGGGPHVYVVRNELRLSVPIGVAFLQGTSGSTPTSATSAFIVGLVPYVTLASASPKSMHCVECGDVTMTGYAANYGVSLALAYEAWGRGALVDR